MLDRRRFLHLAGLSGLSLFGIPLVAGCKSQEGTGGSGGSGGSGGAGGSTSSSTDTGDTLPDDPSKPWWNRQDYAPVAESEAMDLEIVGALPPSLSGLYLRNGPNPESGTSGHWFLGDGMVHGVMLQNGKAPWYRARYIQTEILGQMQMSMGAPSLTKHAANTAILHHAGRLLCLEEVGIPYEISPKDLSTIGTFDYMGMLTTAMTAHPKVDPKTGELVFFGYDVLAASITYHRADAKGNIVATEKIKLPKGVMMHDFQVTETHAVFMDLPIVFDIDMAIKGAPFPFKWAPDNGSRLGVMPRNGTAADVKWYDVDTCFVFHTWNAFNDAMNPGVIHLECVRYPTMWENGPSEVATNGRPARFSIDTTTGKVGLTQLADFMVEFPRISPARQGLSYRYGYAIGPAKAPAGTGTPPPSSRLAKLDRQTGNNQFLDLPDGQELDEALFVPDPAAKNEDDGWLLAYVFDHADNRSQLLVVDAASMGKPVAAVKLPHRVPHGFHGDFVPGVM
jgi:carotenoid cleavage dioxygenase